MVSGGGPLNQSSAVLSPDGKYILVAAACSVKLCSSVTGEVVNSLRGHLQNVTAIVLDSVDETKVYTASLDATVRHWDLSSGNLLATMQAGEPIRSMVIPAESKTAYLQCDWHAQKAGKMLFLNLSTGKLEAYSLRLYSPSQFAVSASGRYVATFFKHTVFVYSTQRPAMQPLKLYHTRLITCVAIDPTEECIAAGDVSGRILIWNAFTQKVPKLQKSVSQPPVSQAAPTTQAAALDAMHSLADSEMPQAAPSSAGKSKANDSDSDSDADATGAKAATASAAAPESKAAAKHDSDVTNGPGAAGQGGKQPGPAVALSQESRGAKFARLRQSVESVPLTTVHWHAHPVGALCFSTDGTLLLSGGQEAVLVLWQLRSGNKTFLPRLGGGLLGICKSPADAACYVVTQADNTVRVVNTATMKVQVSIHGIRPAPPSLTPLQASAAALLAPGGGELVLPADNSMLQFWDAARDCHVDRLQVASRNTVSLTQQDHKQQGGGHGTPQEPHVAHLAFDHTGQIMATVDVRPNAGSLGSDEQSLRFWQRRQGGVTVGSEQEAPFYAVNTFVDDPHRGGNVTSLAYHPSRNMAATTSSSGDFNIWVQQNQHKHGNSAHWRCQSVGSCRGEPLLAAAFSADGSILAVASQDTVSLWDPNSNAMISTLPTPAGSEGSKLCKLAFVASMPYLAAYTQGTNASLIVWNLLTESVWWSYALTVSAMAVDPDSAYIAVAVPAQHAEQVAGKSNTNSASNSNTQQESGVQVGVKVPKVAAQLLAQGPLTVASDHDAQTIVGGAAVFMLDPATAQPRFSWSLGQATAAALMFALPDTPLHTASAAMSEEGVSPLLVLTTERQYAIARSINAVEGAAQVPQPRTPEIEDGSGMFEAAFGKLAVQRPAQQTNTLARKQQAVQAQLQVLFDAPSHVLPPLKLLAPAFFDALIMQDK